MSRANRGFIIISKLEIVLDMSETFLCSMSALVPLLVALQLPMLLAGSLTYMELKRFLLIIFCSGTFLIIKIFIVFNMNTYISFSPHNGCRQ
jgi:hypothetical protein